eukprot:TRINITY_DN6392_c0_g1_i1.p1 TRINITY_DN6392_c0_g1~~TRINITY_DN6392_c0_g1_i1.p1  ORF type:complete len:325 (+),score=43.04 TRINITY_DN6392_c0_g1_i1:69-1043(+)
MSFGLLKHIVKDVSHLILNEASKLHDDFWENNSLSDEDPDMSSVDLDFPQYYPDHEELCFVYDLPQEIVELILTQVEPLTMLALQSTCKLMYFFGAQEKLWMKLTGIHQNDWNVLTVQLGYTPKKPARDLYLKNCQLNSIQHLSRLLQPSCIPDHCFDIHQEHTRILVMGEADTMSAKRLVYKMTMYDDTPFVLTKMFTGTSGLGAGMGCYWNDHYLNCLSIPKYETVLSCDATRPNLKKVYDTVSGLVFVMQNNQDLEKIRRDLILLFASDNVLPLHIPILIYVFEKESPGIPIAEIASDLNLPGIFGSRTISICGIVEYSKI